MDISVVIPVVCTPADAIPRLQPVRRLERGLTRELPAQHGNPASSELSAPAPRSEADSPASTQAGSRASLWEERVGTMSAYLRTSTTGRPNSVDRFAACWYSRHGDRNAA